MPVRIQLRRTPGWRKPAGAAVVSRPTVFGNPWSVAEIAAKGLIAEGFEAEVCVSEYRAWVLHGGEPAKIVMHPTYLFLHERWKKLTARLPELKGRDLACWCPLPAVGQPDHCHASVLLELANRE